MLQIEELARRAAAGDTAATDELLRAIQPQVLRHCARFLPYRQDAEEACQDVLLKVATKIGTFEGRSKFSTWLYEVTSNQARQTYRTLRRREAEHPELIAAFVLRDLSDLEYSDIARHLDVPLGTVKARIHHARRYVRESLAGAV